MAHTRYLPDEHAHHKWDTRTAPALVADSGDTVVIWTRDISDNQVTPDADASVLANFDWDRSYPLNGPIGIHDAEPGDTLKIEILDVHTQGWGWTGVLPGFGLLAEDFPDAYLRTFDLSNGDFAYIREDIAIPLEPYFGTMGVCPAGAKQQAVVPPGRFGGNMDIRYLGRGSGSTCRWRSSRACSPAAMPTALRATARSAARASRRRCSPRCASPSKRAARSQRRSTAPRRR